MASKAESAAVTHYLQFYIQWASITVLWYDYALTFPMEVKYMWGTKPRLSTALYICCRHALITNILYLLAVAKLLGDTHVYSMDTLSCDTWYKVIAALSFFGRSAVIVTFTARTYAIFGRNKWILAYLSALGVVYTHSWTPMCWLVKYSYVRSFVPSGCYSGLLTPDELLSIFMVIFEYSAAIFTIIRTVQAFRVDGGTGSTQKGGILYMIFEQGILYFSIVSLITTAAVVLNYRAPAGFLQRLLNAVLLPLSTLLTARFLLHLRHWEHKQDEHKSTATRTMGSFRAAPGVLSTIIEEFGDDPVAVASSSKQAAARQRAEGVHVSQDRPSRFEF
ncbi:hypothetical protein Moror_3653 [Moniliophthora roreri MCA 2997]|uniref:DUF6533 domain-containing protein n=1 Tax=Moniliophthora roreri (strain MCA 2997) TaxID=1381753 RepID=V2W704_MONRO|nr:hypothetical protein Moror_3653 [Moniliophthora roreri MCA 2997]